MIAGHPRIEKSTHFDQPDHRALAAPGIRRTQAVIQWSERRSLRQAKAGRP